MTRNQIAVKLKEIGSSHRQVRTCEVVEPDYFLDNEVKDVQYPAVWFTLGATSVIEKRKTVSLLITIADIIRHPNKLQLETQSDCELIADDLISQLDWDKHEWNLQRNSAYEYFEDDFGDECAGVTVSVDLDFPFTYDNCALPSDYELPNGNFVYINTNRFMSVADFIVGTGQPMEDGEVEYQNNLLTVPPFVFIDGLLITYNTRSDRRYIVHDATDKKISIIGGVNSGENVRIII